MRLTTQQQRTILDAARRAFGPDACVRLFGSRINDDKRGGDFDLYVETSIANADELVRSRLAFLAELDDSPALSGEKVDVVLRSPLHRQERSIDRVARQEGLIL